MSLTPFHGPPAQAPAVPGFVARMLIGSGAHGEVWIAREQISGEEVALKVGSRLDSSGDPIAREADLLSRFDHPHLVRLRRVVAIPEGQAALVLDLAAGGSLAALVAARGRLGPGEVVTMLVPLAEVLSDLHRDGVVHGDVSPGNVLFTADGRPMLGDLGVGSVLGARQHGLWSTPGFTDPALADSEDPAAADVWGLAAVAWFALTGMPPPVQGIGRGGMASTGVSGLTGRAEAELPSGPLGVLLRQCLSLRPADRPALPDIAVRAWDAVRAEPIRLEQAPLGVAMGTGPEPWADPDLSAVLLPVTRRSVTGSDDGSDDGSAVRRASRLHLPARPGRRHFGALIAGSLATGVAAAFCFGLAGSARGPETTDQDGAARPRTGRPQALTSTLQQIVAARALAFEQASDAALSAADEPGSPAARMDAAVIARLRDSEVRLDGIRFAVAGVHPRSASDAAGVVELTATVTASGHRQVSTRDGRIRHVPASAPQRLRLTLVRAGDQSPGWRLRSVEPSR
jgi:eukaryotic-like serine/threonine-protein kinase